MAQTHQLLSVIELGGYPNFTPLYERHGYAVTTLDQMRKVLRWLKQNTPDVIVAEFNFQSDFRDRTSSLESMMATLQKKPGTRVIVFYEQQHAHQFAKLQQRFQFHASLPFPVDEQMLTQALKSIARIEPATETKKQSR
jgi:DNA-binding NtrC family response regulator